MELRWKDLLPYIYAYTLNKILSPLYWYKTLSITYDKGESIFDTNVIINPKQWSSCLFRSMSGLKKSENKATAITSQITIFTLNKST